MYQKLRYLVLFSLLVILGAGCGTVHTSLEESQSAESIVNDDSLDRSEKQEEGMSTPAYGWGPERDVFTMELPASYPTFNSITNNPTIGDEFDFVRIGQINAERTTLGNEVEIVPGRQYLVYIYVHNNASSSYNSSDYDRCGIALQTRVSSAFSKIITPLSDGAVTAVITANNTIPESVWDGARITTKAEKISLSYVEGSAKIYNDWDANQSILPSSLFSEEGTLIGCNELNGIMPGCEEYHCIITYVLEAKDER